MLGVLEDTGFKIASRIEDNKSLFDIIQNALDITLEKEKKKEKCMFYMMILENWTLKNVESMRLNLLIDEETAENYKYTSTIDGETYNKINAFL